MLNFGPGELIVLLLMCVPILIVTAIGVVLLMRRRAAATATRIPCPYCAEPILPAATVCRFCGHQLLPGWSSQNEIR